MKTNDKRKSTSIDVLKWLTNAPLKKMISYGIVGVTGLGIDFFVTWLCRDKLGIGTFSANTFGFLLATTTNFLLNNKFTFPNSKGKKVIQFFLFFSISVFGLVLSNFVIYVLFVKTSLHFYTAKLFAIGFVFFWNFFANNYLTFSPTSR